MKSHQQMKNRICAGLATLLVGVTAVAADDGFEPMKIGGAPKACADAASVKSETRHQDKQKKKAKEKETEAEKAVADPLHLVSTESCEVIEE